MTDLTDILTHAIRPVNVRRDLSAIANLIELCFGNQMDPDGREYVRHLRRAALDPTYLRWFPGAHERVSFPLHGYVWEEDGIIVGNLTMIPFLTRGQWRYLIANVAVHPDYRRRGIARQLTQKALWHIREHGAEAAWLQVRDDNPAAYNLYVSLGMEERARRSTWLSIDTPPIDRDLPENVTIGNRRKRDWPQQLAWLGQTYPEEIRWNLPLDVSRFSPGFWRQFLAVLNQDRYMNWSAVHRGELLGVLTWEPSRHFADTLWLATNPEASDLAIFSLLQHARRMFYNRRPLMLNFPAGHNEVPFWEAGFELHNTLIWMQMSFKEKKSNGHGP